MKTNCTWSPRTCGRFLYGIQSHNAILRGFRYRWGFSWILSRSKSCHSGIEISSACFDRSLSKLQIWSIEWDFARRRQSWGMLGVVRNLDRFEPMSVKIWNKEVGDDCLLSQLLIRSEKLIQPTSLATQTNPSKPREWHTQNLFLIQWCTSMSALTIVPPVEWNLLFAQTLSHELLKISGTFTDTMDILWSLHSSHYSP